MPSDCQRMPPSFVVARLFGGGQGSAVAIFRLGVAALGGQDLGDPAFVASDRRPIVALPVELQTAFGGVERLVEAAQVPEGVGQVAERGGAVGGVGPGRGFQLGEQLDRLLQRSDRVGGPAGEVVMHAAERLQRHGSLLAGVPGADAAQVLQQPRQVAGRGRRVRGGAGPGGLDGELRGDLGDLDLGGAGGGRHAERACYLGVQLRHQGRPFAAAAGAFEERLEASRRCATPVPSGRRPRPARWPAVRPSPCRP